MTFVLIVLATWLTLNAALFGVAMAMERHRRSREFPASGRTQAEVVSFGGRRVA